MCSVNLKISFCCDTFINYNFPHTFQNSLHFPGIEKKQDFSMARDSPDKYLNWEPDVA